MDERWSTKSPLLKHIFQVGDEGKMGLHLLFLSAMKFLRQVSSQRKALTLRGEEGRQTKQYGKWREHEAEIASQKDLIEKELGLDKDQTL